LIDIAIKELQSLSSGIRELMLARHKIDYVKSIRPTVELINEDRRPNMVKGAQMYELYQVAESGK